MVSAIRDYFWFPHLQMASKSLPFFFTFQASERWQKAQAENPVGLHLNPVYVIPKGDPANPRGWRLIVNNSFPSGTSVNRYFKKSTLPTFANVCFCDFAGFFCQLLNSCLFLSSFRNFKDP